MRTREPRSRSSARAVWRWLSTAGSSRSPYFGFSAVPGGFIPAQDKQYLIAVAQLPPASSLERTEEVTRAIGKAGLETPGITGAVQFAGMSTSTLNASPSSAMVVLQAR